MQIQLARRWLILLQVHTDGRACNSCTRKSEYETGPVFKDKANALILGDRTVHRIVICKHVRFPDREIPKLFANQTRLGRNHGCKHVVSSLLLHALVVVPGVVVASIFLPVLHAHISNANERLRRVRILRSKNLQPCKDRPHTILLAHVIATCAKRLLATDERSVFGSLWESCTSGIHQIAEKLPASRHLKIRDAKLRRNQIKRA
mmetsp:Transcript_65637/g.109061  ORF Transcript_65637/g.109061 Transcript_65637/m.109061 type:complete len:205 (+) Transcript_65637:387-1001(+)